MRAVLWGFVLAANLFAAAESPCRAGPIVVVGEDVPGSRRTPVDAIRHNAWDQLLRKYVDDDGFVAYAAWRASAADQNLLDDYLRHLSAASFAREPSRETRLAFWINAYNAMTVRGILNVYPTTSIRNHTAKVFGYNIWKDLQLTVDGRKYSLDAIEHEVLRKMGEPRIHFAIVCASIGCPRLLNEAYVADRLERQLTANAKAFFADRSKFVFDSRAGAISVSPILDWFGADFGADPQARLRAIAPYLPEPAQASARTFSGRLQFLDYDWGLNDRAKAGSASRR